MNETFAVRQTKFDNGEVSPLEYANSTHPKWMGSLRTCKNWLPIPQGALVKRPGTKYIAAFKDQSYAPRLMRFKFSDDQSFLLEVGESYIRFYVGGKYVGTDFNLHAVGSGAAYYELATPWSAATLPYLVFDQIGNTVTITYGGQSSFAASLSPQDLKRTTTGTFGPWTVSASPTKIPITSVPSAPTAAVAAWSNAASYSAGARATQNNVTWISLQDANVNNSPPAVALNAAGTGLNGNLWWTPAVDPAHQGTTNQWVTTSVVQDPTGIVYETAPGATLTYNGPLASDRYLLININPGGIAPALPAGWTVLYHKLYRAPQNGIYGWIANISIAGGVATGVYTDYGQAPDYTMQPPYGTDPFLINGADSYPAVVGHFDQRRLFGGQNLLPSTLIFSRAGDLFNYDRLDIPGADTDAFNALLASEVLEQIRAFRPLRRGLVLTSQGEWAIAGATGGPISRASLDAKRQSEWGSSWLPPICIGTGLIFNTVKGRVRDLYPLYGLYADIWDGQDLTVMAGHFFEYNDVISWDFQSAPYPVIWGARDDGLLLSMTYQHAPPSFGQELTGGVVAWAQHSTGLGSDKFESSCVVQEPPEDALYLGTQRLINGSLVRYIERMDSPICASSRYKPGGPDVRYGRFSDCSLTYDGHGDQLRPGSLFTINSVANPGSTNPADYAIGAQVRFKNPVLGIDLFSAGVDDAVPYNTSFVLDPENTLGLGVVSAKIVQVVSTAEVIAILDTAVTQAQLNVWAAGAGAGLAVWAVGKGQITVAQLTGLPIDSGTATGARGVTCLSDGNVQPIDSFVGGVVKIPIPGIVVTVGIAYNCDISQLDAQAPSVELRNKNKQLVKIGFELASTRDMWVGKDFNNLSQWQQRAASDAYSVLGLAVGYFEQQVTGGYNKGGAAAMRHFLPVPAIVTSILREFRLGDT